LFWVLFFLSYFHKTLGGIFDRFLNGFRPHISVRAIAFEHALKSQQETNPLLFFEFEKYFILLFKM